jgi:hypothetical protein
LQQRYGLFSFHVENVAQPPTAFKFRIRLKYLFRRTSTRQIYSPFAGKNKLPESVCERLPVRCFAQKRFAFQK